MINSKYSYVSIYPSNIGKGYYSLAFTARIGNYEHAEFYWTITVEEIGQLLGGN